MQQDLTFKLALLIPCYNETRRLKIESFQRFISGHENFIDFYFIDDGSNDGTSAFLTKHFEGFSNFNLIINEKNLGKGNAIRCGILNIDINQYAYLGFIDADLDIPLNQVLKLYESLEKEEYLMAISNREFSKSFNYLRLRSYLSVFMAGIANFLLQFKPPLQDTQCGCKMFRVGILNTCFNEPFHSEWLFDIEVFLRLKKNYPQARNKIIEVQTVINENNSKSAFKIFSAHKILFQLYLIFRNYG